MSNTVMKDAAKTEHAFTSDKAMRINTCCAKKQFAITIPA